MKINSIKADEYSKKIVPLKHTAVPVNGYIHNYGLTALSSKFRMDAYENFYQKMIVSLLVYILCGHPGLAH